MPYVCNLGAGHKIYLDNVESQTIVTLSSSSSGQQQQSSSRFQTGDWTALPEAFQVAGGVAIKISTLQGDRWMQIQGGQLSLANQAPVINQTQQVQVQPVAASDFTPAAKPMEPMEPMTMGDMQMSMNPMEMRMGNLSMRMPPMASSSEPSNSGTPRFCSQCGKSVKPDDRFCSSCGHQLA